MVRAKLCLGVVILILTSLLAGACTTCPSEPGYTSDLEVNDAAEARDAVIAYLEELVGKSAPPSGLKWNEENITPSGLMGYTTIAFTTDDWTITVGYPIVPSQNMIYDVTVSSLKFGWHWKGTVESDGTVTELSPFEQMSEENSQKIAESFVKNSPTFVFDGIEDTLKHIETLPLRCPYCWQFIFEFDSSHAGYGDRTGLMLAEVITPHRAVIDVKQLEITYAVMDEVWDMLNQETIGGQPEKPEGTLTVSELLANPVYDTEVKVYGKVNALGQLNCPCFELIFDGDKLQVLYDMMVEDDGTKRPAVSVEGIDNDDWVVVTGELKTAGEHRLFNDFWASDIEKVE